jgi:hypothetical protein
VNTGGEHLSEHTDRQTENYFLGTPITLFNIVFYGYLVGTPITLFNIVFYGDCLSLKLFFTEIRQETSLISERFRWGRIHCVLTTPDPVSATKSAHGMLHS